MATSLLRSGVIIMSVAHCEPALAKHLSEYNINVLGFLAKHDPDMFDKAAGTALATIAVLVERHRGKAELRKLLDLLSLAARDA